VNATDCVSGGKKVVGPVRETPFPLVRRFQNGPRSQGFASPRNNSAPLTAAGRSKRTPLSKRERLNTERDQAAAKVDQFFAATDTNYGCRCSRTSSPSPRVFAIDLPKERFRNAVWHTWANDLLCPFYARADPPCPNGSKRTRTWVVHLIP
jgi:hypothetical protein